MAWISGQFTTRVIVLMPVAIAINIVLGYIIQTVLKLPIYMDSIGTIFVGVLAGPLAGLATIPVVAMTAEPAANASGTPARQANSRR